MSKPEVGGQDWMNANPDRYALYPCCEECREWIISRGAEELDTVPTLAEAIDAAFADAAAALTRHADRRTNPDATAHAAELDEETRP